MKPKKLKFPFKEFRADLDPVTARDLLVNPPPIRHLFAAKLYVSNYRAMGCLRVKDEIEEPMFEIASNFTIPAPARLVAYMRGHKFCLWVKDEREEKAT